MALNFNGTTFTGTNASHQVNFNGASMCTVFDKNAGYIRFDHQRVLSQVLACQYYYSANYALGCQQWHAYCCANANCYYYLGCFCARYLNYTFNTNNCTACACTMFSFDHSYPEDAWMQVCSNFRVGICDRACVLIPTCCGYGNVDISRGTNQSDYYCTPSYSNTLRANTTTVCVNSDALGLRRGWCRQRRALAYYPGSAYTIYAGQPTYLGNGRATFVVFPFAVPSPNYSWIPVACINAATNCSLNWLCCSTGFRSREVPGCNSWDFLAQANWYADRYVAACVLWSAYNSLGYTSCLRFNGVCAYAVANSTGWYRKQYGAAWNTINTGSWYCIGL